MPEIFDGDHVAADLSKIVQGDLIDAFLTEIAESEQATWQLAKWPGDYHNPYFEAKGVQSLHQQKFNIYRIRPLTPVLGRFRVLYAFDPRKDHFHILAIVEKLPHGMLINNNFTRYYNYEPSHPITVRICAEYDKIGVPRLP